MIMKVQVSSIWNKKKTVGPKDSRIRNHDPDGTVYYDNH